MRNPACSRIATRLGTDRPPLRLQWPDHRRCRLHRHRRRSQPHRRRCRLVHRPIRWGVHPRLVGSPGHPPRRRGSHRPCPCLPRRTSRRRCRRRPAVGPDQHAPPHSHRPCRNPAQRCRSEHCHPVRHRRHLVQPAGSSNSNATGRRARSGRLPPRHRRGSSPPGIAGWASRAVPDAPAPAIPAAAATHRWPASRPRQALDPAGETRASSLHRRVGNRIRCPTIGSPPARRSTPSLPRAARGAGGRAEPRDRRTPAGSWRYAPAPPGGRWPAGCRGRPAPRSRKDSGEFLPAGERRHQCSIRCRAAAGACR